MRILLLLRFLTLAVALAAGAGAAVPGDDAPLRYEPVPPAGANAPRHRFEGRLTLGAAVQAERFRVRVDTYGLASPAAMGLPELSVELLQVGDALVPVLRGPIAGAHPHWEFILGPGRVWQPPGESYARAALPFSLLERDANCLHNGVLSFGFGADGGVSPVAYQVSSETCAYLEVDLWGARAASYTPYALAGREAIGNDYLRERAARLPRQSMAGLARDFPGADPAAFGHPDDAGPARLTTWGVLAGGVHYTGGCPTRAGEYPFCDVLHLPSYSLAKSLFAGLALMRLEKLYPGARREIAADYVPECAVNETWADVSFEHLLDMASGHYRSALENADEDAEHALTGFFTKPQHRDRIHYACQLLPRREPPGRRWVYHTSDTYLLGAAMTAYFRKQRGAGVDLFDDLLLPDLWRPLGLSPVTEFPRRTRDAAAQPYTGYGLTLQADDVLKLARFLQPGNPQARLLLDAGLYRAALQLEARDRGLPVPGTGERRYNNGFWALRVEDLPGCPGPQFIPFMSGFGGISVVLLPNGVIYYSFGDGGDFRFRRAIHAAAQIRGYCRQPED